MEKLKQWYSPHGSARKQYTAVYGHWLSDFFVLIGSNNEQKAKSHLDIFLILQLLCVFILHVLFPMIQFFITKGSAIMAPQIMLPMHAIEWLVIFFGMGLVFSPSDYADTAPTFFEIAWYTTITASITTPLSTLWICRIYAAIRQAQSARRQREKILRGEEKILKGLRQKRSYGMQQRKLAAAANENSEEEEGAF
eukprot:g3578.t1